MSITFSARTRLLTVAIGAVATALTVLTGCTYATHGTGSAGGFLAPVTPSANSTVGAGTGTDSAAAPTQNQLNAVVLRDGDLPDNWQESNDTTDNSGTDDGPATSKVPACAGLHATEDDQLDDADTAYSDGSGFVETEATSFSSAADVTTDEAYLLSPKFVQCFHATGAQEIESGLPAGTKVSALTMTIVRGPTTGNVVATAHSTITLTSDQGSARIYDDDVFISGRQLEAEITFTSAGGPVPAAFEAQVVALVAKRAALV